MHNSSETITTFFSALEGEKLNSAAAQSAFPPVLKSACLRAAQFSREGRLENLSDKTYMRLKDRFFESESESNPDCVRIAMMPIDGFLTPQQNCL